MSEWQNVALKQLVKFGNGKSRPKEKGKIPVYGGNGILDFTDKYNYVGNTLIIGRVGAYCGATYLEKSPVWVSDNALSAKALGNNDSDYLYYLFKYLDLNQYAQGSSHPLLTQTLLNAIEVETTLDGIEQKAIASVLSSLDNKIDLLHRQNKTLESMAETLFRQWFVEEAQDDWEEKKFSDLFEIRDGTHDSPKQALRGYPLITSKHIDVWSLKFNDAYLISESDYDAVNKRSKVEQYDILFSMIGTLGRTYIESSDDINYAIKNIGLFKTSQNPNWKYFTYLWLVSENGKVFIDENKSGSTQEYISLGSLRSIKFMSPPLEILKEFNLAVEGFFNKIFFNVKNIQTLEKLRDTLLPKLMSGEVRVSYTPEEIKQ